MMTERPILFNDADVRAILSGAKTQTRRPVKAPFEADFVEFASMVAGPDGEFYESKDGGPIYVARKGPRAAAIRHPARIGDQLWVRECWYCDQYDHARAGTDEELARWREDLYYRADVPDGSFHKAGYWSEPGSAWRPSIHMPRWASRLTLRVTNVRVERVQDITEADARAEGFDWIDNHLMNHEDDSRSPRESFSAAWPYRGADSWTANPWVWAVTFTKEQP